MFRNNVLRSSLLLYEIYVKACSFTKINTPPWVIFTFFKLYKWYQIAQGTTYIVIQKFDKGYYFVVIMLLLYTQ